jgi:response regulator RpfG family c-di-GMP phosphodiesterase
MRMPQMTGVTVLERAQRISPDTTRLLLTGDADPNSAMAAINEGHVFDSCSSPARRRA